MMITHICDANTDYGTWFCQNYSVVLLLTAAIIDKVLSISVSKMNRSRLLCTVRAVLNMNF